MPHRGYLDLHVLHTVPYANLNRDDLGSPKSLLFGGEDRIRVSSQCWKRAVRLSIEDQLGEHAIRTRGIARAVARTLHEDGWPTELATFAGDQIIAAIGDKGLKTENDKQTSSALVYLVESAITDLAEICTTHRAALEAAHAAPAKKSKGDTSKRELALPRGEVEEIVVRRNGIISLFGRMLAELRAAEVDGAVQVAHAFTTHGSTPQIDFFTAVDDLNTRDETGSGHMNSAEFSAGVFYRYASVNIGDLITNLAGDLDAARRLAGAFATAFLTAIPGAKKNSTAPFTVPDLAYVTARTDRPVSLAAAFEEPVRANELGSFAAPSRTRLADYTAAVYRLIGTNGLTHHAHASIDTKDIPHLGDRADSFAGLVDGALTHALPATGQ